MLSIKLFKRYFAFVTCFRLHFCIFTFYSLGRTRGSPDFTQPPSSSNSSTTSSPSRRIQYQRRFMWPISLWANKFSSGSSPVPVDDASTNLQRSNGSNGIKVEISRPMPLRPTKFGGVGPNGGVRTATSNNSALASDRPPSSASLAQNLVGHGFGFTLSPLTEQADSSFDSFDSADTATEVSTVPAAEKKDSLKEIKPISDKIGVSGVVAARANFFSGNSVATGKVNNVNNSSTPTLPVPVRPAPTVPVQSAKSLSTNKVVSASSARNSVDLPVVPHTEIIITKTVVPVGNPQEVTVINEFIKTTSPTHKSRPLSTPNAYSVKAIFNRGDQQQPSKTTDSSLPSSTSTLQKMAALFKPSAPQIVAVHVTEKVNDEQAPVSSNGASKTDPAVPVNSQSIKAAKINRESLRHLEISHPIPQNAIELPSKVVPVRPAPAPPPPPAATTSPSKLGISTTLPRLPKSSKVHFADVPNEDDNHRNQSQVEHSTKDRPIPVERSESMRLRGVTQRPNIPQFGSMRMKRPLSVPFARPTSPPPNPPSSSATAISPLIENDYPYDDCTKASIEDANIYASIEELQTADVAGPLLSKRLEAGSTTTTNSDGLLSEIVSELKKKNLDDVYSVSSVTAQQAPPLSNLTTSSKPVKETSAKSKQNPTPVTTGGSSVVNSSRDSTQTTSKIGITPSLATIKAKINTPQTYKPYSSSSALRNRYLGGIASTPPTTSSALNSDSSSIGLPLSSTSTATSPAPTLTTFSPQSASAIVSSTVNPVKGANLNSGKMVDPKPSIAKTEIAPTIPNALPLPQQPPVGRLPGTASAVKDQAIVVQSVKGKEGPQMNVPVTKPLSTFGKSDSKRPLSPDRNLSKTIHTPTTTSSSSTAATKSKFQNSKTTGPQTASKLPAAGTNVKTSTSSFGAPKKTVQSSQRPVPVTTNHSTTSAVPSIAANTAKSSATSPSYSVSPSSLIAANPSTVPSGKVPSSSSSSIVQSMQQKLQDASNKPNKVLSQSNESGTTGKNKLNPKR